MRKLVSLFAIAAMILVACACNKQDQPDEGAKVSDLQYLLEGLMRTDEHGSVTGYMIGDNLNPANPYDISVPVDNFEEAVELFMTLLPPDAAVSRDATSVTWDMTDGDGRPDGKAVLKKNEELGAVASLTVTPLLQASGPRKIPSVTFLPPILWPENAGAAEEILNRDYYVGAAVWKEKDEGFGKGEFLVIQEWTPKESGIMIQMVGSGFDYSGGRSAASTLHRVHKALKANYDLLVNDYGKAHNWPSLDRWFSSSTLGFLREYYVNLENGKEDWFYSIPGNVWLVHVYCFKPDGDKIKFW
ncbi:MAG: hypothetical protein J6S99_04005 [Bacteroidales bacterium]|nr:hypothetical protein [Bacteroidales bacterium]